MLVLIPLLKLLEFVFPHQTLAQTQEWTGACVQNEDVATIQGITCMIGNVLGVILPLIGLAAFIMLVVGSVRWMLSGGSSQNVEKARNTMVFAVVGIVLALTSYIIINILADFTGIEEIRTFTIPSSSDDFTTTAPP